MNIKIIWLIIWVFISTEEYKATCVYKFEFPTVSGQVYTVQETATISIPFLFVSTCNTPDNFKIKVAKNQKGPSLTAVAIVCQIIHVDGKCYAQTQTNVNCTCMPEPGSYLLTKVAEQSDNTTWLWWRDRDDKSGEKLVFNITEPGKIPDITEPSTTSNSSQDVTSNTTDHTDIHHSEPFYMDIKTIVYAAAGLSVVVIVAIIIACARKNKRRFEVQAATRHEAVADPELQRQGPAGQVTLYREFRWDSMDVYPEPVEESPPFPHVTVEAAAVDDDGYLVPVARRKTSEDAPMLLPPAPEAADDDHEYMTPVPSREGSTGSDIDENGHPDDRWNLYERPEYPDYTVPNPVYEPLRHLYQAVRQATIRQGSQPLPSPGEQRL